MTTEDDSSGMGIHQENVHLLLKALSGLTAKPQDHGPEISSGEALSLIVCAFGGAPIHVSMGKQWLIDMMKRGELRTIVRDVEIFDLDFPKHVVSKPNSEDGWFLLIGSLQSSKPYIEIDYSVWWSADDKHMSISRIYRILGDEHCYIAECRNILFYDEEIKWLIGASSKKNISISQNYPSGKKGDIFRWLDDNYRKSSNMRGRLTDMYSNCANLFCVTPNVVKTYCSDWKRFKDNSD